MSCVLEIIGATKPEWQEATDEMMATDKLSDLLLLAYHFAKVLARNLVEEILHKKGQLPQEWPTCPDCGRKVESKGRKSRQLETRLGVIQWKRSVGRCPNRCKIGQKAPLDTKLGLAPNQKTERYLQQISVLLAVFVPFETASMLLAQLLGIQVSPTSIWNWVQQYGKVCMEQLEAELAQLMRGELPEPEKVDTELQNLLLLIGADGVMVPFRPHNRSSKGRTQWREVKIGILARLQQYRTRSGSLATRLKHHRVVAVLGNIDDLGLRLRLEAYKQAIWLAPKVVWISDGAKGFWRLYHDYFQDYAIGILDFYHASQNLWQALKVWLDGRTLGARLFYRLSRSRLRLGRADVVLADIQNALQLNGLPANAKHSLTKVYNYLYTHRDHIDYDLFKQSGCPIGSGFVESTCKWLIQQRFKGVGMRWSEDGFNHLLHLRLAWVNNRFDDLFFLPP
ncbi:MAG: ISKra4 family transposase [Sphaerospermopsis sp. SIO1G2]|nr:ISKra4 family transposase [Sphaerospermopsis sp. SIO1G2]